MDEERCDVFVFDDGEDSCASKQIEIVRNTERIIRYLNDLFCELDRLAIVVAVQSVIIAILLVAVLLLLKKDGVY